MCGREHKTAVRVDGNIPERLLLRAGGRERREPRLDASTGRIAHGTSGVWKSPLSRLAGTGRSGDQPKACGSFAACHGSRGDLSPAFIKPADGGASNLSVSAKRLGNHGSGPGLVQRHHLCADGVWIHVFGGGDGLVEPVCVGVGTLQQSGQRVLHSGLDLGAGGGPNADDLQYRSRMPVHQRCLSGRGRVCRSRCEHGWSRAVDRQPFHRAPLAECEAGRYLPAGLRRWTDGTTRTGPMVRRLQWWPSSSILELCDAGGMVFFARVLWGQTGRLAVEVGVNLSGVQPSVRPYEGAHSGLDVDSTRWCNIRVTKSHGTQNNKPQRNLKS